MYISCPKDKRAVDKANGVKCTKMAVMDPESGVSLLVEKRGIPAGYCTLDGCTQASHVVVRFGTTVHV